MAREKYGYAESSDLKATIAGHIHSVVHATDALENGMLMKLGKIKTNQEIYEVEAPEKGDKVVLILSALYSYDTSTTLGQHEMFLRKECGEAARAYDIEPLDRYAVADYMIAPISDKVVKGNLLVADVDGDRVYKELTASSSTTDYGFVAEIENIVYKSNLTLVEVRIIKNEDVTA